jgi:hypothetical protein
MTFYRTFFLLLLTHLMCGQTPDSPSVKALTSDKENVGAARAGHIYVDGINYPLTQTGIQQAFTDACVPQNGSNPGTDVYLPPMVITTTLTAGEEFLITCSLHIHGAGPYNTWFTFANTVPSTVPMFHYKPTSAQSAGKPLFEGIKITSSGSFGGAGILFDSTYSGIAGFTVQNMIISNLSPASFAIDATGANNIGWGLIAFNDLFAGIRFVSPASVDSTLIMHNVFSSVTGFTGPCIDASTGIGAAHITAFNNNGGCAGGFFVSHGTTQCKILYNQIEQSVESTEPNLAMIDLMGDSYPIDGCEIVGNNINAHTFATTNIRVGRASHTSVYDNVLALRPGSGVGVLLTSSSSLTRMPFNHFLGEGAGAVAYKNASAASNFSLQGADGTLLVPAISFAREPNTGFLRSGAGRISVDIQGKSVLEMSSAGTDMAGNAGYCHTASGNAQPPAIDTCMNRLAPGVIGIGTSPGENKSGLLQSGNTVRVAVDFTASTTRLQTIAGLSWKLPATQLAYSFHCALTYSELTGDSEVAFGIQAANSPPLHLSANGIMQLGQTTFAGGALSELQTTTATPIVMGLPSATHNDFVVTLDGTIENGPSGNTLNIMVATPKRTDTVVIKRGSYCQLF